VIVFFKKVQKTTQDLFKLISAVIITKVIAELDRNKNFWTDTIRF